MEIVLSREIQLKLLDIYRMEISNKYLKSVALLATGSVLGQVIGFIGSIIMTRLYTESEIGIMTTIISVTGIFAPIINGRLDFAIVKEQNEQLIYALIKVGAILGIIFSFLVSIFSYFYFASLSSFINVALAMTIVLLILLITTFTNLFKGFNNNIGDYKTISSVIVYRRFTEETSMLIFGLLKYGSIGLLISVVIGQFAGMRREMKNIFDKCMTICKISKMYMKRAYQIHKKQIFLSSPAALLNATSYSVISLVIGKIFGMDVLGIYAISFAVLGMPLAIISGNVSQVYFREASKEFASKGSFFDSTLKTFKLLFVLSIGMFLAMYYIVPYVVPFIYGSAYTASGVMIKILAIMFAVRFVSSALNPGLVVAGKQQMELYIQLFFLLSISVVTFVVYKKQYSINYFLIGVSITYSIVYAVNMLAILKYSKAKRL